MKIITARRSPKVSRIVAGSWRVRESIQFNSGRRSIGRAVGSSGGYVYPCHENTLQIGSHDHVDNNGQTSKCYRSTVFHRRICVIRILPKFRQSYSPYTFTWNRLFIPTPWLSYVTWPTKCNRSDARAPRVRWSYGWSQVPFAHGRRIHDNCVSLTVMT